MVEEERYLLELVRNLHLNALRAQRVAALRALDRYAWSGHSALLGLVARPWQATAEVLARFARNARRARRTYRAFMARGIPQGRRPELQGGGLLRSHGGGGRSPRSAGGARRMWGMSGIWWMEGLCHPGRPLAAVLGVRPQAVYQAGARGRHGRAAWDRLLEA